ncbi:hypothetical protein BT96DRAFT_87085 [Gymnopus androsaceus JB14]|uniref:Uncharacterized protein n=1 Tax=Gymnopus androsaceus JB14 TaxID=1447944 RepID=A0A6A4HJ58_9AGAR|nr:hypothetical protein BT96DRAFT_87085 [Gymnopus androsaceus JB14]
MAYTENSVVVSPDDNAMDVDTSHNEQEMLPKDVRILYHLHIIDIFVGLLRELVEADQRDEQWRKSAERVSASMHAPSAVASIHALNRDADVDVLLGWVQDSPSGHVLLEAEHPRLDYFLAKPYQKNKGSRPGNEWSRQDWLVSLRKLRTLGQAWGKRGEATFFLVFRVVVRNLLAALYILTTCFKNMKTSSC